MLLPLLAMFMPGCLTTGKAFAELSYPEPVSQTRTLKVGTATVAYTDQGEGQSALVLVHGLGSYLPAWKDNVAALAEHHRVIAIDLPGYGKSSKRSDHAYSMAFFAGVVQGVIEELDLRQPVIVGHSMGGQIAITHALRYPGKARALVLTSPAGLETFEDGEAQWMADAVTEDFTCKATPDAIWGRHVQNFHRMPKDAHFMATDRVAVIGGPDFPQYCRAVSKSVRAMLDEPVYARLPEVAVPALVVFGTYDQLIPNPFLHGGSTERLARKTVTRLPKGELVMLPSAGHMAQMEQADAWNRAVLEFLRKVPVPPAPEPEPVIEPEAEEAVEEPVEPAGPDPRRKLPPSAYTPTPAEGSPIDASTAPAPTAPAPTAPAPTGSAPVTEITTTPATPEGPKP